MSASNELLDLYQSWKQLTEREGKAIVSSNWSEVRRCQEAKQQLQPAIIRSAEAAGAGGDHGSEQSDLQKQIRAVINDLIQLENQNNAVLQKRLTSVEEARVELDQTAQRLRRVHGSYVPKPGSAWNQYS
ncbi:MAG TPA: hypothetical protein VGR78_01710 [Verrucomicrobiae bacterium]|jgi:hypothetical protein|nr:hypothetical protein [Verrucomicrobiae bacterium]